MVKSSHNERRTFQRIKKNVPLKISHEQGDAVTETVNLSRSGAYCQVEDYLEPMTKLKIQLLLPVSKNGKTVNKKVTCNGVVVRVEPSEKKDFFNVAIFFNEISEKNTLVLADYVQQSSAKDA